MTYDRDRPVPWRRLILEWLVVGGVIAVLFATVFEVRTVSSYVGLLIGGVFYLLIGALLAKFGYQRARLQRPVRPAPAAQPSTPSRSRPAPTRRTNAPSGGSRQRRRR